MELVFEKSGGGDPFASTALGEPDWEMFPDGFGPLVPPPPPPPPRLVKTPR